MAANLGIFGLPPDVGWRRVRKFITTTQDFIVPADWQPWMGMEVTVIGGGKQGGNFTNGFAGSFINDIVYGLCAGQRITCTIGAGGTTGGTSSFGTYLTAPGVGVPASGGSPDAIKIAGAEIAGPGSGNTGFASTPLFSSCGIGGETTDGFTGTANGYGVALFGSATGGCILIEYWTQAPWGGGIDGAAQENYAPSSFPGGM